MIIFVRNSKLNGHLIGIMPASLCSDTVVEETVEIVLQEKHFIECYCTRNYLIQYSASLRHRGLVTQALLRYIVSSKLKDMENYNYSFGDFPQALSMYHSWW